MANERKKAHLSDIAILVPSHREGKEIVDKFREHELRINHVFGNHEESRKRKVAFEMGVGKLKICTIHSFKGWEVSNIIVVTPSDKDKTQSSWSHYLFYTAITRVKRNIIVFNRYSEYNEYGADWKKLEH